MQYTGTRFWKKIHNTKNDSKSYASFPIVEKVLLPYKVQWRIGQDDQKQPLVKLIFMCSQVTSFYQIS
jgi:hypothetical protein